MRGFCIFDIRLSGLRQLTQRRSREEARAGAVAVILADAVVDALQQVFGKRCIEAHGLAR